MVNLNPPDIIMMQDDCQIMAVIGKGGGLLETQVLKRVPGDTAAVSSAVFCITALGLQAGTVDGKRLIVWVKTCCPGTAAPGQEETYGFQQTGYMHRFRRMSETR